MVFKEYLGFENFEKGCAAEVSKGLELHSWTESAKTAYDWPEGIRWIDSAGAKQFLKYYYIAVFKPRIKQETESRFRD